MRKLLKAFSNVAANSTASLSSTECDGYTLDALHFVLGGGNTKANMTRIEVRLGGRTLIDHITGTQLENMNTHVLNRTQDAADLAFYLSNPKTPDYNGKHLTGADLSVIKDPSNGNAATLEIQVDLGAGAAPTLKVYAELSPSKAELGYHPKDHRMVKAYVRTQLTPGAALNQQQQDIAILAHGRAAILREWWYHGGNMTSLEVKKDNIVIWDDVPQAQADAWNLDLGHPLVANLYVFDVIAENNIEKMLSTVKDKGGAGGQLANFQHLLTTSAADTLTVFTECVIQFDNI